MTEQAMDENRVYLLLRDALNSVGITQGDTVLCHTNTDVLSILMPEAGIPERMAVLEAALRDSVGPSGTIVVPTFTYAFCDGKKFDKHKTSTRLGLFPNWIRRREGAERSDHPIFSFAAIGAKAHELMSDVSLNAFDDNSVFARLNNADAKILFFNCTFSACTFVHFVERCYGVTYRYDKTFTGLVRKGDEWIEEQATHFVRNIEQNVVNNFDAFERLLQEEGLLRFAPISDTGELHCVNCNDVYNLSFATMENKPYIFLDTAPHN